MHQIWKHGYSRTLSKTYQQTKCHEREELDDVKWNTFAQWSRYYTAFQNKNMSFIVENYDKIFCA